MTVYLKLGFLLVCASMQAEAQTPGVEFFEKKIRPVLAEKCYLCHSSKLKTPMGGLVLDTKAGFNKGGATGALVTPGKPLESRLIEALRFSNPRLQMPPTGKLPDAVIADFTQWVAMGVPDPRPDEAPTPAAQGIDLAKGRQWWAFQPVRAFPAPPVANSAWPGNKIDAFILAKLDAAQLRPSPPADPRTLIRRVYLNLTGLAPTFEETESFAADDSPEAYQRLVDRLLQSPHYGERWGRYWLDVARYAEDNPTTEATNPPYPFAWRYRDWVIEAFNQDVPYDRFVKLQLAADLMPGATRQDLRALGYLGAAPLYHKDLRLSQEVIETLAADDWDERVDAVTRGLLGLTVACARCHDHKFDPIPTKDYYALAGVFASSYAGLRPLFDVDPATESRYSWMQQQLFFLDYLAKLMTNEPGTKPEEAAIKVQRFRAEIDRLKAEAESWRARYPELWRSLEKFGTEPRRVRGEGGDASAPFTHVVQETGLWVDGSDADLTLLDFRAAKPRELPIFLRGSVATPGEPAPRGFLSVLSGDEARFHNGSGRLELGEKIFSDAAPLAARVIVNRAWGWHFGKPLVSTPSDFGSQGERASHPELLDDLAARFISSGWSLKWLHREILLSNTYRQSSYPRSEAEKKDPTNRLVWRMNPRRLDLEAFRDVILQASGKLDGTMYGPSKDLDAEGNHRRTVYARVSRARLNVIFKLYDFPDPSQHSPEREQTTTALQQLFLLNSPFIEEQAAALALRAGNEPDPQARIRRMYRLALARDPSPKELDLALTYLEQSAPERLAQALLSTNELIFWP